MQPKNANDMFDLAAHLGHVDQHRFTPPSPRGVAAIPEITSAFEPLLGLPSWSVKRGHGTFITMEFGDPLLEVSQPHPATMNALVLPRGTMQRSTDVHGRWHLWIYCCVWTLALGSTKLADSDADTDAIGDALRVLNGQALTAVAADPGDGTTLFQFDLGGTLRTRPAPAGTYTREPIELWKLTQPNGHLQVRTDGTFAHIAEGEDPRTHWWQHLDSSIR